MLQLQRNKSEDEKRLHTMPGIVCPEGHEKANSREHASRPEVARGTADAQTLSQRLAQSIPRFIISSASGTSKSLRTWPSEE
jgi:hypothetical protein